MPDSLAVLFEDCLEDEGTPEMIAPMLKVAHLAPMSDAELRLVAGGPKVVSDSAPPAEFF